MTDAAMPSQRRRARLVLILIAGIPLSMMLGATALWWAVEQGHVDVLGSVGTANHGKLIDPPRSVTDVVFQHEGVAETLWQDLPAKWRLLVVQRGENCDAICQQQLYQTRQIHLALGKDFNRVGRVVLSDTAPTAVTLTPEAGQGVAGVSLSEWLAQEHVGKSVRVACPGARRYDRVDGVLGEAEHACARGAGILGAVVRGRSRRLDHDAGLG